MSSETTAQTLKSDLKASPTGGSENASSDRREESPTAADGDGGASKAGDKEDEGQVDANQSQRPPKSAPVKNLETGEVYNDQAENSETLTANKQSAPPDNDPSAVKSNAEGPTAAPPTIESSQPQGRKDVVAEAPHSTSDPERRLFKGPGERPGDTAKFAAAFLCLAAALLCVVYQYHSEAQLQLELLDTAIFL
ncbi:hypothetical protein C8F01DRAFT_1092552 [Mycena amicta]|nr:hypothetical protein C8F01DRAFT_1092552 [Mycena amicta]